MPDPDHKNAWKRLSDPEVKDRIYRFLSIGAILILVGGSVVLLLAFVMKLEILAVAFLGLFSVVVAFYVFDKLWPREMEPPSGIGEAVVKALEEPKPVPLSPEEYRRQKERAQKLIRDKAAPALAKAIRGILNQDKLKREDRRRRR